MKKILFLLVGLLMASTVLMAQNQNVTLTPEQMKQLGISQEQVEKVKTVTNITENLETAGKWAGMGKEIGIAANETLKAITGTAVDVSKTDLGKFTMLLVAWKVVGHDMIRIAFGCVLMLIIIFSSILLYRNNTDRSVLISRKWDKEGKGWQKDYKFVQEESDYKNFAIGIFVVGMIAVILILVLPY